VSSIESFFSDVKKNHKGVDILINNAGIQHVSPVEDFGVSDWDRVIAINLTGVLR
jgi:3-hydroxybutyrate dehydrogenase